MFATASTSSLVMRGRLTGITVRQTLDDSLGLKSLHSDLQMH